MRCAGAEGQRARLVDGLCGSFPRFAAQRPWLAHQQPSQRKRPMRNTIIAATFAAFASLVYAQSGGSDRMGCRTDNSAGVRHRHRLNPKARRVRFFDRSSI
jgi:hypothetical protein